MDDRSSSAEEAADSDNYETSEEERELENESSSEDETATSFKGELSMEELLKMREKVGSKVFDKKLTSHVSKREKTTKITELSNKKQEFMRTNKNRPLEMSSKRPVRKVQGPSSSASKSRDPRFDEMCGTKFDKEVFENRFSFLTDIREKETKVLKKKLKKTKSLEDRKKLQYLIQRFDNQKRETQRRKEENEVIRNWRREEKKKVAEGKKPYFLKDSDKKRLIQEHRKQKKSEKKQNSKKNPKNHPGSSKDTGPQTKV